MSELPALTAKERNRQATEPGGCECMQCGVIFIGAEWHGLCGLCCSEHPDTLSDRAMGTQGGG